MSEQFKRVLFVGTGGGNDVFSTTLAMAMLWHRGWRWHSCDIAGALSPFHRHTTRLTEFPHVHLTTPETQRFLLRYDDAQRHIGFIDAQVSAMIQATQPFGAERVLGLSLAGGSQELTRTFHVLSQSYDRIVLVDLGGDIFYAGPRDAHVLSPMFDSMMLRAYVDADLPDPLLFEAGPGTDGELTPEALRESFMRSDAKAIPLDTQVVLSWHALWQKWIEPARPGRTVPMTVEACHTKKTEICLPYRARAHFGGTREYAYHDQRIDMQLCRQAFLVDPRKINNPFAVDCSDPYDWFVQTQLGQQQTNHEAALEYLHLHGQLWQFLIPSPLFAEDVRRKLLEEILQHRTVQKSCDGYWLLPSDWEQLLPRWESTGRVDTRGPLVTLQ